MLSTKIRIIIAALVAALSLTTVSMASALPTEGGKEGIERKEQERKESKEGKGKCKYLPFGPTAVQSAFSPAAPSTGDSVTFDGSKSAGYGVRCIGLTEGEEISEPILNAVDTYHWNFGDGQTQDTTTPTATHRYKTAGSYTVKLTVSAGQHTSKNTATETVPVADRPPTAAFRSPSSPVAGTVSVFDASASADPDGTIANYHWVFGDGVTRDTSKPTIGHSYATGGSFEVALTVTDNSGKSATTRQRIRVVSRPHGRGTDTGGAGASAGGSGSVRVTITSRGRVLTRSHGGKILLDTGLVVACPAGSSPCRVSVEAVTQADGHAASAAHGKRRSARRIVIAKATLTIAPGAVGKLRLKLNSRGAALLRRHKHLGATLLVAVNKGTAKTLTVTRGITITAPGPGRHKH